MFEKKGTPNKIGEIAKNDSEFEDLKQKIANENDLIRCSSCSHLLAKKSADGNIDIQHKKLSAIASNPSNMEIKCPVCQSVNRIV